MLKRSANLCVFLNRMIDKDTFKCLLFCYVKIHKIFCYVWKLPAASLQSLHVLLHMVKMFHTKNCPAEAVKVHLLNIDELCWGEN